MEAEIDCDVTSKKRLNHEPPVVTAKLGWRYHHIGIPHTQPRAQEHHAALLGVHVAGFETSPYGIEWVELLQFDTAKAVRPETRRAAEQRAAPDDGAPAKEMRRRR